MQGNFERYIKHIKRKLVVMSLATLLPIILVIILEVALKDKIENHILIIIFRYIILGILECFIISKVIFYIRVLKNEEYAKNQIIKRSDERLNFVNQRASALAFKIMWFSLTIGAIVFGFIDEGIFFTLIIITIVTMLILFFTKIYYHKKY